MVSQPAKTSARGWRTRTGSKRSRRRMATTTPAPARFAIQHTPQRLTAPARTEPLLRHLGADGEEHVAARPLARLTDQIFRIRGWALARARRGRLQLRRCLGRSGGGRFSNHLLLDAVQGCFPARRPLLALPFPIAARLLPTTLLTEFTGPVTPRAPPPPPAGGLVPAASTAIPLLRPLGLERLFTTLEQTAPPPKSRRGDLSRIARRPIQRQAHGSAELPGSSRAAGLVLRCEAFLSESQHTAGRNDQPVRRHGNRCPAPLSPRLLR